MHLRLFVLFLGLSSVPGLTGCSLQHKMSRLAKSKVLRAPGLSTAHIGISLFEPATGKFWYDYQGEHYFVPASNIKIPTCYAAMKYLGDSLVGIRYAIPEDQGWKDKTVVIEPTGDPSFLHPDFPNQPVMSWLQQQLQTNAKKAGWLYHDKNQVERWGNGWSWNDYEDDYMAERSGFPIFGNLLHIRLLDTSFRRIRAINGLPDSYRLFHTDSRLFDSLTNHSFPNLISRFASVPNPKIRLRRDIASNKFRIESDATSFTTQDLPFATNGIQTAMKLLEDSFSTRFTPVVPAGKTDTYSWETEDGDISSFSIKKWIPVYSQPTDSLLKPMMHNSDNFFAEQSLLMVSHAVLGYMNDQQIIDTLLKTIYEDLPQKPRWADGSGLSRYNLFSPRDFVSILGKMREDFGMERIAAIFPTGGEGTLTNYYRSEAGFVFAKTGTLSGVVALSGFLYTKKKKLLIFSTLVNNNRGSATEVRRAVEGFIREVRNRY